MSEKTLSNNPPVSTSLAAEAGRYRASMAGFLQKSLAAMNGILSTVDLDGIFCPIDQAKFDEDPMMPFRRMSYLLIAKARLHVFAALSANKSSNIHSLAVQMRPALECAGQVVSLFKDLFGKYPRAESTIRRHLDVDYYQTVVRVSRGQIDHDELLKQISVANPMRKEPLRKIMRFRESEKVRDLEFGGNWYDYLSNCFYHSDLSALKDLSYYGGSALLPHRARRVRVCRVDGLLGASGNGDGHVCSCLSGRWPQGRQALRQGCGTAEKEKGNFGGFPEETHVDSWST